MSVYQYLNNKLFEQSSRDAR